MGGARPAQGADFATERFPGPGGLLWWCAEGRRRMLEEFLAPHLLRRDGPAWRPLKVSQRRQVHAFTAIGHAPLVVKRYPARKRFPESLRDTLRPRGEQEFEIGRRLHGLGLPVPFPVASVEHRHHGTVRESFFVAEEVVGAVALGPYLEAHYKPGDGRPDKRDLVARAAALLTELHDAGIHHRDFHGGNLLIRDAEGPAGRLWLIDYPLALTMGNVPADFRARDYADLFDSLRHALDEDETRSLFPACATRGLTVAELERAWARKRRRTVRSAERRAFGDSSRFRQAQWDGLRVQVRRDLEVEALRAVLEAHRRAIAEGSPEILRSRRRNAVTVQDSPLGPVVVKEFRPHGGSAQRRARASWRGGFALRSADIPTAEPLALVVGPRGKSSYVVARQLTGATALHVHAARWTALEPIERRRRSRELARLVLELLVRMVRVDVVHSDLSPKNWMVREGPEGLEVLLVDWDAVRSPKRWNLRRLLRALVQTGDVPAEALSLPERLRFLREILVRLGLENRRDEIVRATDRMLRARRRLPPRSSSHGPSAG